MTAPQCDLAASSTARGHVVAVIGDGVNDSPALAHADASISLKAASDVARETAGIVLHGDLEGVPLAVDIAREALGLIRQNLLIAGAPNGLVIASLGAVGPPAATAVNNGSNVAAALNTVQRHAPRLRPARLYLPEHALM